MNLSFPANANIAEINVIDIIRDFLIYLPYLERWQIYLSNKGGVNKIVSIFWNKITIIILFPQNPAQLHLTAIAAPGTLFISASRNSAQARTWRS